MQSLVDGTQPEDLLVRFVAMLRDIPFDRNSLISYNALARGRAAAQLLIPLDGNSRVLDLGCGWGTLSVAIAPAAGEVVAMDLSPLRARFTRLHARSLGMPNVTVLGGGDTRHLPFADCSFDAVMLNGVLEWVGEPLHAGPDPDAALRAFLSEVRRVLNPGGRVLIGIENRFSAKYMLGMPEEHVGQRYVSLLPRRLADAYLRRAQGRDYRIRTYGHAGIAKLLKSVGFTEVEHHVPLPHYRQPTCVAMYGSYLSFRHSVIRHQWRPARAVALEVLARTGLLRWLVHSFVVVARQPTTNSAAPSEAIPELKDVVLCALEKSDPTLASTVDAGSGVIETGDSGSARLILLDKTNGLPAVVVLVGSGSEGAAIRNRVAALNALSAMDLPLKLRDALPRNLGSFEWGRRVMLLRRWDHGQPLLEIVSGVHGESILAQAVDWLISLHSHTQRSAVFGADEYGRVVTDSWRTIQQCIPLPSSLAKLVGSRLHSLSILQGTRVSRVFSHGDFEFRNLLQRNDGSIGVIDWELADPNGLALGDLVHLLVAYVANRHGHSFGSAARALFIDRGVTAMVADRSIARYRTAIDVPEPLIRPLIAVAVLRDAAQWARRSNSDLVSDWWTPHLLTLVDLLDDRTQHSEH